jgi:hypothetical protein
MRLGELGLRAIVMLSRRSVRISPGPMLTPMLCPCCPHPRSNVSWHLEQACTIREAHGSPACVILEGVDRDQRNARPRSSRSRRDNLADLDTQPTTCRSSAAPCTRASRWPAGAMIPPSRRAPCSAPSAPSAFARGLAGLVPDRRALRRCACREAGSRRARRGSNAARVHRRAPGVDERSGETSADG